MNSHTTSRLKSSSALSWSANAATFNFWDLFSKTLSALAGKTLGFEDLPLMTVKIDPLNLQGRWTGSKYAIEVTSGCLRFNAEFEQLSSVVMFGFHAVGMKNVLGTDERILQVGWLRIDEIDNGFRIESKPVIDGCVTDNSLIDYGEFSQRPEIFAAWVFDFLINKRFDLLKVIATEE